MSLKEALKVAPPRRQCTFTQWIESLDDEDREAVREAMDNSLWSIDKLTRALKDEGAPINYDMIRKHRANSCPICNR